MDPRLHNTTDPSRSPEDCPPGITDLGGAGAEDAAFQQRQQRQGDLRQQAQAATREAPERTSQLVNDAKSSLSDAAEQTKRKAGEYAQTAKVRGQEMLDQQKHRAADQLHTVEQAVHRAAEKFRQDNDDNIAGYVDAVAEEVGRFADYLERRDLSTLVGDTQSFARREPEWFLGGMFLAGLALTRFLKSSGRGDGNDNADLARTKAPGAVPQEQTPDEPWVPERSITGGTFPHSQTSGTTQPSAEVHSHGQQ